MNRRRQGIRDLLERIGYIEAFTQDGRDIFLRDIKTQEAVIRCYEVIGEILKRIPADTLDQHPEIEWRQIMGFRDFLIHNYDKIQAEYVWNAVEQLPMLKAAVEAMQRGLDAGKASK